jgi:hypothetical protein
MTRLNGPEVKWVAILVPAVAVAAVGYAVGRMFGWWG